MMMAAGGFPATGASVAAANGTFYAVGGEANDSTHVSVFVNGTQTGPTVAVVTNSTSRLVFGQVSFFAGPLVELGVVQGVAVSSGNMSTIGSNQKSYWGF